MTVGNWATADCIFCCSSRTESSTRSSAALALLSEARLVSGSDGPSPVVTALRADSAAAIGSPSESDTWAGSARAVARSRRVSATAVSSLLRASARAAASVSIESSKWVVWPMLACAARTLIAATLESPVVMAASALEPAVPTKARSVSICCGLLAIDDSAAGEYEACSWASVARAISSRAFTASASVTTAARAEGAFSSSLRRSSKASAWASSSVSAVSQSSMMRAVIVRFSSGLSGTESSSFCRIENASATWDFAVSRLALNGRVTSVPNCATAKPSSCSLVLRESSSCTSRLVALRSSWSWVGPGGSDATPTATRARRDRAENTIPSATRARRMRMITTGSADPAPELPGGPWCDSPPLPVLVLPVLLPEAPA